MTEVFVDSKGNIYETNYKVHITWDEFGGIAEGYLCADIGSDGALREFVQKFNEFKEENNIPNAKYKIEMVDEK